MPNIKKPRVNKSKKDIVSDLQLIESAKRRRSLVKDILFPYLVSLDETVGYSKVFLQAFSGLINGVFDEKRKTTTIQQLNPRLMQKLGEIFDIKDDTQKKEYERYLKLIGILENISIEDLSYATELPRYIDGYMLKDKNKEKISVIKIDEILG
jgi:hypothetical protein